ncbi:MAG: hypothetical protein H6696_00855 [Deferribacteres bacterium]|nr:hypothetical protein [Deferribacteres bacterium]
MSAILLALLLQIFTGFAQDGGQLQHPGGEKGGTYHTMDDPIYPPPIPPPTGGGGG